jgi:hypothetical protein
MNVLMARSRRERSPTADAARLSVQTLFPIELAGGHGVFHSLNPSVELVEFSLQTVSGTLSRVGVTVIKLPFVFRVNGQDGLRFHQERRTQVNDKDRPKTGENEEQDGDRPRPEHGEVKVMGYAPADPQDRPLPGSI